MPIATGFVVTVAPRVGDLCLLLVSVRTKDAFISLGCYVPEICAEGLTCEKEVYRVMKNLDSHGRCKFVQINVIRMRLRRKRFSSPQISQVLTLNPQNTAQIMKRSVPMVHFLKMNRDRFLEEEEDKSASMLASNQSLRSPPNNGSRSGMATSKLSQILNLLPSTPTLSDPLRAHVNRGSWIPGSGVHLGTLGILQGVHHLPHNVWHASKTHSESQLSNI
ncbi:hypothetical protein CEXT_287361 [Caerostris extrusa]|uniref:Uncharacterized protein n=1 Tax=Caerostris extrusa TaxID=172846 RepID=A0AAV4PU47_CAEEX|nr:hypothetical protein CEXT_287361 [Caerostris extrusa]